MDDHSSANRVATAVKLPTRTPGLKFPVVVSAARRHMADLTTWGPYSALLRVGLAIPFLLPEPWWALTPPFHHHHGCVQLAPDTMADSSLWRFPWGCPRRALPGTLLSWSPDFPRVSPRSSSHPRESGDRRKRGLVQGLSSWLRLGLVGASSGLAADGGFTPPAPVGYLRTEDANFRKIRQKLPRRAPRPHRPGRGHPPSRGLAPMAGSAGETR